MPVRIYMVLAIFFFGMMMLIGILFGDDIADWGREQQFQAEIRGQNAIATLVFDPIIWAFESRPIGPIVAGLLWPAIFIWLLLTLIGLLIIAGVDVATDVDEVTRLFRS